MSTLFSDTGKDDIIKSESTLRDDYIPDEIKHRDKHIATIQRALQPVLRHERPTHLFLRGPPGTGKSLLAQYLPGELREEIDQRNSDPEEDDYDLRVERFVCERATSPYQIYISIANRFRSESNQLPKRGLSTEEVAEEMIDSIEAQGGTVLLILDEVTKVGELNSLLFHASRQGQPGKGFDKTNVGLIMTANEFNLRDNYTEAVGDSFNPIQVDFGTYTADELSDILAQRAELAFSDRADVESAVRYTAAKAAQRRGNARYALDVLQRSAYFATQSGEQRITEDDVDKAINEVDTDRIERLLSDTPQSGKRILCTAAWLSENAEGEHLRDGEWVSSRLIQKAYQILSYEIGSEPISQSQASRYFTRMKRDGLIEQTTFGSRRSWYRLRYPAETVRVSLNNDVEDVFLDPDHEVQQMIFAEEAEQ